MCGGLYFPLSLPPVREHCSCTTCENSTHPNKSLKTSPLARISRFHNKKSFPLFLVWATIALAHTYYLIYTGIVFSLWQFCTQKHTIYITNRYLINNITLGVTPHPQPLTLLYLFYFHKFAETCKRAKKLWFRINLLCVCSRGMSAYIYDCFHWNSTLAITPSPISWTVQDNLYSYYWHTFWQKKR